MVSGAFWCPEGPDKKHLLGLVQNTVFRNGYKFSENKEKERRAAETKCRKVNISYVYVHVCVRRTEKWLPRSHQHFAPLT